MLDKVINCAVVQSSNVQTSHFVKFILSIYLEGNSEYHITDDLLSSPTIFAPISILTIVTLKKIFWSILSDTASRTAYGHRLPGP